MEVFTTDAILLTATCSWFCTMLLEFSSMFLCKISFSSSSNVCLPFSVIKENRRQWENQQTGDVKKGFFFATFSCSEQRLTCSTQKGYFTIDKNGRNLFSKEFSCSCAINKFRSGTLCRILSYSAEHLKIPDNYSIGSYLLRIEKKSVIFSGCKQIPQRNTMLS